MALCWVHAGRHFKKFTPLFAHHRAPVATFLGDFWAYYHELQAYRQECKRQGDSRPEPTIPLPWTCRRSCDLLETEDQEVASLCIED